MPGLSLYKSKEIKKDLNIRLTVSTYSNLIVFSGETFVIK